MKITIDIHDEVIVDLQKAFPSLTPERIAEMALNRLCATILGVDDNMKEEIEFSPGYFDDAEPEELFSQLLTREEMQEALKSFKPKS